MQRIEAIEKRKKEELVYKYMIYRKEESCNMLKIMFNKHKHTRN